MNNMIEWISQPWPWYVAGPLIGLTVPLLLVLRNKVFGISSTLEYACSMVTPASFKQFNKNWKERGAWKMIFAAGIVLGGFIAQFLIPDPNPIVLSAATQTDLAALGVTDLTGYVPSQVMSWSTLFSVNGLVFLVIGGFLVGFGARYAGGCTSGHSIAGLANLQVPSLIATVGFFAGGIIVTHLIIPLLLG